MIAQDKNGMIDRKEVELRFEYAAAVLGLLPAPFT